MKSVNSAFSNQPGPAAHGSKVPRLLPDRAVGD